MFDSEELQNECSHRSDWRKGRLGKFQTRTWKVSCWIKASVLRHSSGWMSVCHLTLQLRHVFGQLSLEGLRKAGEQSGRQLLLPVLFVLHLQGQQNCFYVLLFSFYFYWKRKLSSEKAFRVWVRRVVRHTEESMFMRRKDWIWQQESTELPPFTSRDEWCGLH